MNNYKCLNCGVVLSSEGKFCSQECKNEYLINNQDENVIVKMFKPLIEKIRKYNQKKNMINQIKHEAEIEALQSMKSELVEINKQKLLKKMTKSKSEALKDAFKLNIDTNKVLQNNFGNNNFNNKKQKLSATDKILGFNNRQQNNNINFETNKPRGVSNQNIIDMISLKKNR